MSESHRPAAPRGEQLRASLILLAVAVIWGSAFVAQRTGMERIGPFTFNGVRFVLGSVVLLPFLGWRRMRGLAGVDPPPFPPCEGGEWRSGALLGLLLFAGASFQQTGLVYTTAGKAGFITGLYVVLVPLLSVLVWRVRIGWSAWLGAGLAVVGLFLLSAQDLKGEFRLAPGDGWVLAGAFAWALHVIAVGRVVPGRDPLRLAMVQYGVCALLCLIVAVALERMAWADVLLAKWPVLYAGVFSTGLAYTGQVVAQRHAASTHAALILSLESVFAALFGWLLLGEVLTARQLLGCGLMLAGMLLAQITSLARSTSVSSS
jgi:drug/metabolite transporter (DMT)-like permease